MNSSFYSTLAPAMPATYRGTHRELSTTVNRRKIREALAANNFYNLDFSASWFQKVLNAYQQPHRFFHTLEHLRSICEAIAEENHDNPELCSKLLLTGLFHDSVWFPQCTDNEERSAAAFDLFSPGFSEEVGQDALQEIREAIIATKNLSRTSELAARFHNYDCRILLKGSSVDLLAYEFQIFREFQYLNVSDYIKGRSAFFTRFSKKYPEARESMKFLVDYLERRRPRIGVYAGTFNPFHIGHLSILEKAEALFDKVIIAVGINPDKKTQRYCKVEETLPFHEVVYFDTLIVDLLEKESQLSDVTLVRGLRNGYDLDYEMNQQCFMKEMRPETRSIYIPCDKNLEHISSTALSGLRMFNLSGRDSMYYPKTYNYYSLPLEKLFE